MAQRLGQTLNDGVTDRADHAVRAAVRDARGVTGWPASVNLDVVGSVLGAQTVGAGSRGYDADKTPTGKRHNAVGFVDAPGVRSSRAGDCGTPRRTAAAGAQSPTTGGW